MTWTQSGPKLDNSDNDSPAEDEISRPKSNLTTEKLITFARAMIG